MATGAVNNLDLGIWQAQYGTNPLAATSAAVPEPTTLLSTMLAAALLTCLRRNVLA